MIRNLNMGITRQPHPAFAKLQRRRAELLNHTPDPAPDPEPGPAPLPPPQPRPTPLQAPAKVHLREQALYGLAGQVVRTLAPHTEAHPAAILLQFLAAFGNAVGPRIPRLSRIFSGTLTAHTALIAHIFRTPHCT